MMMKYQFKRLPPHRNGHIRPTTFGQCGDDFLLEAEVLTTHIDDNFCFFVRVSSQQHHNPQIRDAIRRGTCQFCWLRVCRDGIEAQLDKTGFYLCLVSLFTVRILHKSSKKAIKLTCKSRPIIIEMPVVCFFFGTSQSFVVCFYLCLKRCQ